MANPRISSKIEPGQRYGRLMVMRRAGSATNGDVLWECACDCGGSKIARASNLRIQHAISCGCLSRPEARRGKAKTHGMSYSLTYHSWAGMVQRCTNSKNPAFPDYGGRGITVCDRWRRFENSLADMGERPPEKTLDRRDTNGHYEPSNCRWATLKEQARNTRANRIIEHAGKAQTIAEWAEEFGIKRADLTKRIWQGMPLQVALLVLRKRG